MFVAIAVSALVLRLAVTSFSPLAAEIRDDLGFSTTVTGVFGMLPTVMFAVFGLATPALGRRIGLEYTALVAMTAAALGLVGRALAPETASVLGFAALAFAGMGIGNVVVPPLVKRYFSHRLAVMSTVYIVGVQIGTIVPAFAAVPLAEAAGWRVSLGLWAVVAIVAALPWIPLALRASRTAVPVPQHAERTSGRAWRSPVGRSLMTMFAGTALVSYTMFAWIPEVFADAGASAAFGGAMVGLFSALGLVSAFAAPSVCVRLRNPFPVVAVCAALFVVAFAGLLFAPMAAPVLWIVLAGLGPSTFPMSLTLINLRARTHDGAAALSGFTQGVGYVVASTGPLLFGVLHDATGGWIAPFGFLTAAVALVVIGGWGACKPRMLEDSWGTGDADRASHTESASTVSTK